MATEEVVNGIMCLKSNSHKSYILKDEFDVISANNIGMELENLLEILKDKLLVTITEKYTNKKNKQNSYRTMVYKSDENNKFPIGSIVYLCEESVLSVCKDGLKLTVNINDVEADRDEFFKKIGLGFKIKSQPNKLTSSEFHDKMKKIKEKQLANGMSPELISAIDYYHLCTTKYKQTQQHAFNSVKKKYPQFSAKEVYSGYQSRRVNMRWIK
jgi:hypothetical protein